jgi:hypothetical protein
MERPGDIQRGSRPGLGKERGSPLAVEGIHLEVLGSLLEVLGIHPEP